MVRIIEKRVGFLLTLLYSILYFFQLILIRKVAEASLTVRRMSDDAKGRKRIIVTNNSSIRWIIARAGQRTEELRPHSSQIFTAKTKDNTATLLNTWSGEESHIVINLFDLAK